MNKNETGSSRRTVLKSGVAWLGAGLLTPASTHPVKHDFSATEATPASVYNVRDFGATGNRDGNATQPFRRTIETCTSNGGGVVYVPAGDYTVGTVQLRNHVTLHLEAGATLFLSQNREDFVRGGRALIFADSATNIAVTGRGTLDGLARYDYAEMQGVDARIAKEIELARESGVDMRRYYRNREAMNTNMFIINDSTDVLLEGVSIVNSPLWTVRLNDCDRVFVRGVHLYSNLEKGVNADGIDICSCSNVTISNSVIETADDSIVIK
ncbi:MAG: glycosyl hydrolase family 28 protein, partial [Bacteroidota bacterium]|nr:glycosyl hydrolase family 28 protein [Bacteroidota bacterium]